MPIDDRTRVLAENKLGPQEPPREKELGVKLFQAPGIPNLVERPNDPFWYSIPDSATGTL